MPTAGPNLPSTGADNGTSGGTPSNWTTPGNITANDANNATSSGQQNTDWLLGTGFGFSIPANATITAVKFEVDIKGYTQSAGSASGWNTTLWSAGAALGSDGTSFGTLLNFLATVANSMYGLTTAQLTPAVVNAAGFGVQLYVDAFAGNTITACPLNYFQLTITYTLPAGGMVMQQRSRIDGRAIAMRRFREAFPQPYIAYNFWRPTITETWDAALGQRTIVTETWDAMLATQVVVTETWDAALGQVTVKTETWDALLATQVQLTETWDAILFYPGAAPNYAPGSVNTGSVRPPGSARTPIPPTGAVRTNRPPSAGSSRVK